MYFRALPLRTDWSKHDATGVITFQTWHSSFCPMDGSLRSLGAYLEMTWRSCSATERVVMRLIDGHLSKPTPGQARTGPVRMWFVVCGLWLKLPEFSRVSLGAGNLSDRSSTFTFTSTSTSTSTSILSSSSILSI